MTSLTFSLGGTQCVMCGKHVKEGMFFTVGPTVVFVCMACSTASKRLRTDMGKVTKKVSARLMARKINQQFGL